MEDIAIYGAGGLGREIACLIRRINQQEAKWNFIGFFDDGKAAHSRNEYGVILGGMDELNAWSKRLNVVIAIGIPETIKKVVERICNERIVFPNLVYGFAYADEHTLHLGKGNIIGGSTYFSCNVELGDFNI